MARIEGGSGVGPPRPSGSSRPAQPSGPRQAPRTWSSREDRLERTPAGWGRVSAAAAPSVGGPSAVTAPSATSRPPAPMVPVLSLDLHARLAVTGSYNAEGQGVLGLTQAQVEEYVRQGYGHAVVGLPTPWVDRYDEAATAARQGSSPLGANGVAVDAYRYLYWRENGRPRTAEDVYRDVWAALDNIKGQPGGAFWLDVEGPPPPNPP